MEKAKENDISGLLLYVLSGKTKPEIIRDTIRLVDKYGSEKVQDMIYDFGKRHNGNKAMDIVRDVAVAMLQNAPGRQFEIWLGKYLMSEDRE
jgi:hypothetical protein